MSNRSSGVSFQTRFYATMLGKYIANALRQQKEEADALGPAKNADQKVVTALQEYLDNDFSEHITVWWS